MNKWCPQCKKVICDPGTGDLHKYAIYWRDNKCLNAILL
jgi:hypothetical protein